MYFWLRFSICSFIAIYGFSQCHADESGIGNTTTTTAKPMQNTTINITTAKPAGNTTTTSKPSGNSTSTTKGNTSLPPPTVSSRCVFKVISIITDKKTLLYYVDASGKPGTGMLKGNMAWQGAFDECLEMKNTRYCTLYGTKLLNNSKLSPQIGICAPNDCSNTDIILGLDMLSKMGGNYNISLPKYISFPKSPQSVVCPQKLEETSGSKVMIGICGFLAALCFLGSVLDVFLNVRTSSDPSIDKNKKFMPVYDQPVHGNGSDESTRFNGSSVEQGIDEDDDDECLLKDEKSVNSPPSWIRNTGFGLKEFLLCFSLIRNSKAVLDTESPPGSITSLNGIRTISMLWVILGHIFLLGAPTDAGFGLKEFLLCFSLIRNSKAVLDTESPPGSITSLNGIRTISMLWVILGHIFVLGATTDADNVLDAFSIIRRFTFLPIANGVFSVDSFFLLSGLLVSYLSLRRFDKLGKLPLIQYYVHRYLRLTPSYLFVILFTIYVFRLFGDSFMWRLSQPTMEKNCRDNWWTNILYINNFIPVDSGKECIGWSWYLANDMQFYVISPIILYIMYKTKFIGTIVVNTLICIGSFIVTAVLIGHYDFSSILLGADIQALSRQQGFHGDPELTFMNVIYIKPYCRIQPYIVGLVLGYILHHKMKLRGQFKWVIVAIGWCVAIVFGLSVTYGTWKTVKSHPEPFTKADNIIYGAFSRFTWGLSLAWVIYACHFGYGGLVNKFLSWKAFIPLSRLTYGAYLLHLLVLFLYYFTLQTTHHYSDLHISFEYVAVVGISYMSAFILAIWIEFPFANLEKLVLQRK